MFRKGIIFYDYSLLHPKIVIRRYVYDETCTDRKFPLTGITDSFKDAMNTCVMSEALN